MILRIHEKRQCSVVLALLEEHHRKLVLFQCAFQVIFRRRTAGPRDPSPKQLFYDERMSLPATDLDEGSLEATSHPVTAIQSLKDDERIFKGLARFLVPAYEVPGFR